MFNFPVDSCIVVGTASVLTVVTIMSIINYKRRILSLTLPQT